MNTNDFKVYANGHCKASKLRPNGESINLILQHAGCLEKKQNLILIGRYNFLERNGLDTPKNMDIPNLCLMIKKGKLIRAFYSNVMTHVIKKLNYHIEIIN